MTEWLEAYGPRLERAARLLLWLSLAYVAVRALRYAGALIEFPYQVDWREAAPLRSALAISQGRNPWDPAWVAEDGSVYGAGFPWLAAKLLPAGWLTLGGLRCLSLAMLAGVSALVGACGRRLGASALGATAAGLLVFSGLLFSVTPLGRGDALAVAGLVGPLALTVFAPGRAWALAAAALLAALGVLAKAYAGFALVWVALYLWMQGRRGDAGWFVLAWGLAVAAGAGLAQRAYPGSLEASFTTVNIPGWLQWPWVGHQNMLYLFWAAWPLPLALAAALLAARPDRRGWAWLAVLGSTVAVVELLLGRNHGAILTYYFQFLHPIAALCLLALAARGGRPEPLWMAACLALAACLTVSLATKPLEGLAQVDLRPWRLVDGWVAGAKRPLLPQLLCSMATAHGKPVQDNGHTTIFAGDGGSAGPIGTAMRNAVLAQQADWDRALRERRCDLVLLQRDALAMPPAPKGYRAEGILCLGTPANIWQLSACFNVYRLPSSKPLNGAR
jgi:hypothetical protein